MKAHLSRLETALNQPSDLDGVHRALHAMDERLEDMTLAIAEGIERVDRSERRVRQVVSRAKKQLDEFGIDDPGLSAEASQLHLLDGEGSQQSRVQPMPENMAPRIDVSGIPGAWSDEDIQTLSGRYS